MDLSFFFVVACHNDRQTLNNYIEPCVLAGSLHALGSLFAVFNSY